MCRKRVGVIFGGRSAEHEISLKSAATVAEALNSDKFVPVYIGITKRRLENFFRRCKTDRKRRMGKICRGNCYKRFKKPDRFCIAHTSWTLRRGRMHTGHA